MAVYIDNFYATGTGNFGRMKMSHMIADTHKELIAMIKKIGVDPKWIQYPGGYKEHFDICMNKRKLAIKFGAKEVGFKELAQKIQQRRMAQAKQHIPTNQKLNGLCKT